MFKAAGYSEEKHSWGTLCHFCSVFDTETKEHFRLYEPVKLTIGNRTLSGKITEITADTIDFMSNKNTFDNIQLCDISEITY